MKRKQAYISLNPNLSNGHVGESTPVMRGRDYEVVDLLSYEDALHHMKRGYGCARMGFTQRGPKWVEVNQGDEQTLSFLQLVYHPAYPGAFAGYSVPWAPSRCDQFEDDWFIHPLAPLPQHRSLNS